MTAQPWEPRLARLEGAYEQLDRRFGDLVARVNAGFTHVDKGFEALLTHFLGR